MFPYSWLSGGKKTRSDPQNNPKRDTGRLHNWSVHLETEKGLKSSTYKATYRESIIPHPGLAPCPNHCFLFHTELCFHIYCCKCLGPPEARESSFWLSWRAHCWRARATFPEEWSPFPLRLSHRPCEQRMQTPLCQQSRLWLNLGWTFPHKTRYHIKYPQNQEYFGKTIIHLFNQEKVSRSNCYLQCTPHKDCWLPDRVV